MNRKKKITLIISLLAFFSYLFISITQSLSLNIVPVIITSLTLTAFLYIENDEGKKKKLILLLLSFMLSLISVFIVSIIQDNADTKSALIKAISSVYLLIPLIILIDDEDNTRRKTSFLSLILSSFNYLPYKETIENYYYFYSSIADYSSFLYHSRLIYIFTLIIPIEEIIFNTSKNYLSILLIMTSSIMSIIARKQGEGYLFFLILLIYISRGKEEMIVTTRRKIILSKLEPVEIEKIRKKKKPKVYEIPPNLPVDDRVGEDIQ